MQNHYKTARAFRLGIAGPVGSGKTALVDRLSRRLWPKYNLGVVTNDIYAREDAEFLMRQGTLPLMVIYDLLFRTSAETLWRPYASGRDAHGCSDSAGPAAPDLAAR